MLLCNMEPNIYNRWNGSTYSDELAAAFHTPKNAAFLIGFMKFSSNVTLGFIIILLAFSPFLWWYIRLNGKAISNNAGPKNGKKPEQVPYLFPLIGNVISYLMDAAGLAESITQRFGASTVVRVRMFRKDVYVVSGAEYLNAVWKSTKELTSTNGINIALSNMFGTPKNDMKFFEADDSGITHDPFPHTSTRPQDRVFYLMHKATVDSLAGSHLVTSAQSFQTALAKQIEDLPISDDWVEFPDLFNFLRPIISCATIEAMCGSYFVTQYPKFTEYFWQFNADVPKLLQGWPKWLVPGAWVARDRCIETMKKWRKTSSDDNFNGNAMIPQRWGYFSEMKGLSEHGVACSDLGILWGINSNSMPATFWLFWQMIRDPQLLSKALEEVRGCIDTISSAGKSTFDVPKLCNQPLLQSSYAETLRLYVAVYIIRKPEHGDAQIRDYVIPKGKMILMSSRMAHMDMQNWDLGSGDEQHPVEKFWAERFLTKEKVWDGKVVGSDGRRSNADSRFSLNGYSGAWIPFGGGIHQCPGRHWVKLQMILSFAMMCTSFEIELTDRAKHPEQDLRKYGLGALQPKNVTPFRIRRKRD